MQSYARVLDALEGFRMSAKGEVYKKVLVVAAEHSQGWLDSIPGRGANLQKNTDEIKTSLGTVLPNGPTDPAVVVERLIVCLQAGNLHSGAC